MKSGIYKILNKINGKFYIGSASYLNSRKSNHKRDLIANKHKNCHLQSAFNKYGIEAFEFIIIEYCDKQLLLEREQYWLDATQCYNRKVGYNILKIANSRIGVKHTEETKAKFKKSWQSENRKQLDKERKLGKKLSAEGKLKKSLYMKSQPNCGITQEMREKSWAVNRKAIVIFENGISIKEFSSVSEASKFIGIAISNVSKAIRKGYMMKNKYIAKYK